MSKSPLDSLGKIDGNVFGAADVLALTDASVQYGPTADRPTGSRRHDGKLYFDTTVRQLLCWDATNSVWSIVSAPAQWTTWTPTITQSAGLTSIARNVDYATYFKLGRFVTATWTVTITGSGTSGYPVAVSLPVPAAAYFLLVGVGEVYDTSGPGGAYKLPFTAFISTSTTIDLRSTAPAGVLDNRIGVATGLNIGLASGDQIYGTVTYEAAS